MNMNSVIADRCSKERTDFELKKWCRGADSNRRRMGFQALFERGDERFARREFERTHQNDVACHSGGPVKRDIYRPHGG